MSKLGAELGHGLGDSGGDGIEQPDAEPSWTQPELPASLASLVMELMERPESWPLATKQASENAILDDEGCRLSVGARGQSQLRLQF
mmetsp:Transcript_63456/g.138194  ORF Transcript_63456/g.138194 Transcript_63456/m.138194 type:complete len:87 (-) Transcript_63456:18-278(-)